MKLIIAGADMDKHHLETQDSVFTGIYFNTVAFLIGSLALSLAATLFLSGMAFGYSHSYINQNRSSTNSHVFFAQTVEGEYGDFSTGGKKIATGDDGETEIVYSEKQSWKGFGLGTRLGLELMKFIQFEAGHTFVNLRHGKDALETLDGSRFNAGARLVFQSPMVNLEFGLGAIGSRLDYRKQLEQGSFYGSGNYQTIGLNYFMTSKVSLTGDAKLVNEHLVRNSGSSAVKDMDTSTTTMGLGLRIWI